MKRALTTILLLLPFVASAEADPGDLMHRAEQALDEASCFKIGCTTPTAYPAAMTQVQQALAQGPSGEHLLKACSFVAMAQGDSVKWAIAEGVMARGLAWCDAASRQPDLTDDQRKRARMNLGPLRQKLWFSRPPAEQDARLTAAARALYGEGLTIRHDAQKGTVSLDYGALDDAAVQAHIAEVWAALAPEVAPAGGHLLLDPRAKGKLCWLIATKVSSGSKALRDWCALQAVREGNAPLLAFRGRPVTYPAGPADAGLASDDAALAAGPDGRWDVAITVAAPTPVDDQAHIARLRAVAGAFDWSASAHRTEIAGLVERAEKVTREKEAALAREEASVVKKRPMAVFAAAPFTGWTMPALVTSGGDCAALHFKAFAPAKGALVDLQLEVDGTRCASQSLQTTLSESLTRPTQGQQVWCGPALAPPEHRVVLTMYALVAGVVGKEVVGGVERDRWAGGQGKKLGSWATTCTTRGR